MTRATRMHVPFEVLAPSAIQEGGMPEWRVKLLILAMAIVLALTLDN